MIHYRCKTEIFILTSAQLDKLNHNSLSWYVPRDTRSIERVARYNNVSGATYIVKDGIEFTVHHDAGCQYYIVEG